MVSRGWQQSWGARRGEVQRGSLCYDEDGTVRTASMAPAVPPAMSWVANPTGFLSELERDMSCVVRGYVVCLVAGEGAGRERGEERGGRWVKRGESAGWRGVALLNAGCSSAQSQSPSQSRCMGGAERGDFRG